MKRIIYLCFICLIYCTYTFAKPSKLKRILPKGIYINWGYNKEWYTKSTIHFKNEPYYNFTVHKAAARDRPNFEAIVKGAHGNVGFSPSIPQYQYRLGLYINKKCTKAIEINFDHTKYVVTDYQQVKVSGTINEQAINQTMTLDPKTFLHFEHTNGANFLLLNYVITNPLLENKKKKTVVSSIIKAGAGIVIPKTDVTLFGKRLDNKFHIAGYCLAVEGGGRAPIYKNFFTELTTKMCFANYINALTMDGGKASHSFFAFEVLLHLGYTVKF